MPFAHVVNAALVSMVVDSNSPHATRTMVTQCMPPLRVLQASVARYARCHRL